MNRSDQDDAGETIPQETGDAEPATTDPAPYVAKLVATPDEAEIQVAEIRVGSPFREDPKGVAAASAAPVPQTPVSYADFGPFLYTAMGASSAAVVVLLFAAAGAFWFPTGGALVAILGTVLSIIGLFSTRKFRYAAIAMLPLHMTLFFVSYARSLG